MRSLRTLAAAALAVALAGCSSSSFGLTPQPNGDITITDTLGNVLTTSWANPYQVGTALFSINASEKYFGGPYSVSIVRTSGNSPCFVPTTSAQDATQINFNANNAGPTPTGDVCSAGEEEQAQISDSKGHSVYFTYLLTATITKATSVGKKPHD
jgi:hypothetical protein